MTARPVRHQPRAAVPRRRVPALHERENVVFALIGGDVRHGGGGTGDATLPFPAIFPRRARGRPAGRLRPLPRGVAGLSGRVALPAAYAGARAGRVPFVLWATIWRHPRTPAHALSYLPLRHIYRHADAIATYGPHVSAYVRDQAPARRGLRGAAERRRRVLVGARAARSATATSRSCSPAGSRAEKGVDVLRARGGEGTLVLAGEGPLRPAGRDRARRREPIDLRNLYAGSDVVVVPSVPTRDFLEPWGLVVNEAFHQGVPVIATDAVGAAAGGLVQHERTGLVVPAGDADALRAALHRLRDDPALRARLGAAAPRRRSPTYTHAAWAEGMSRALAAAGATKGLLA